MKRSYSAFFPQCLLQRKVFNTYLWNEQWKTSCLLQSPTITTSPVILSPVNHNRSDCPIFWALYMHSHMIILVDSRYLKSRDKALVSVSTSSLSRQKLSTLLLIDYYCSVYYSFLIQQLIEKNFKRKPSQKSTTKNHKMFFSKNNMSPNTQGRNCFLLSH